MPYANLKAKVATLRGRKSYTDEACARICGDSDTTDEERALARVLRDMAAENYHIWHDLYLEKGE